MTKVTEGYVLCTVEGEFLRIGTVSTHIGYRAVVHVVASIDDASVSSHTNIRTVGGLDPRGAEKEILTKFPGAKFVPVKVTRTVELLGFG